MTRIETWTEEVYDEESDDWIEEDYLVEVDDTGNYIRRIESD